MDEKYKSVERISRFRNLPIEDKTIFFMENNDAYGARGIASYLLKTVLADEAYADYKIVWATTEYQSVVKDYSELLQQERCWLVKWGSHDFIKALNTAKYIIAEADLPAYFLKREGQEVWGAVDEAILLRRIYSKSGITRRIATVHKVDKWLCFEDARIENFLYEKYGVMKEQIQYLNRRQVYHNEVTLNKPKVVFSVSSSNHILLKSVSNFMLVRKRLKGICDFYDWDLEFRVGHAFWKLLYEHREECDMTGIHCYTDDLSKVIPSNGIVIAENSADAYVAQKLGLKSYMFYKANEKASYGDCLLRGYCNANKVEDVLESLERLLPSLETGLTESVSRLLLKPEDYVLEEDNRKKVLFVLAWQREAGYGHELNELLQRIDTNRYDVTVLFRSTVSGELYQQLTSLSKDIKYTCRTGDYLSTEEECRLLVEEDDAIDDILQSNPDNFLVKEWERILGKQHFDMMYAEKKGSFFWQKMYNYAPADEVELFKTERIKRIIKKLNNNREE